MSTRLIARISLALLAVTAIALVQPAGAQEALGRMWAIPTVAIQAGELISSDKLSAIDGRKGDAAAEARYATREYAIGRVARRTLLPGQIVTIDAVRAVPTVQTGQAVRLIYEATGVHLAADGTALTAGGAGETVQVRNRASGALLRGTVLADGSILIGHP